jgi:hypothetical protein
LDGRASEVENTIRNGQRELGRDNLDEEKLSEGNNSPLAGCKLIR